MNQRPGLHRITNGEKEFLPLLLWRTYRMRRSKGFNRRNAFKDAWKTVHGIY